MRGFLNKDLRRGNGDTPGRNATVYRAAKMQMMADIDFDQVLIKPGSFYQERKTYDLIMEQVTKRRYGSTHSSWYRSLHG